MGKKLVSARTTHVVPKTKKKAKKKPMAPKVMPDNVQHREDFERLLDDAVMAFPANNATKHRK